MKKIIKAVLIIALVVIGVICVWLIGYHTRKSQDNLPSLESVSKMDEAEVNELLVGYRNYQLEDVWGKPYEELSSENTWVWKIDEYTLLRVSYNNKDKIVACSVSSYEDWGIELQVTDVSAAGLTLECTQSGGNPSGELQTGSYYIVEKKIDSGWEAVEYLIDNVGWTEEAWMIPVNDTVIWKVDWEWLYGKLPSGDYRIGKEIMDFRGPGDFHKQMVYAEFGI